MTFTDYMQAQVDRDDFVGVLARLAPLHRRSLTPFGLFEWMLHKAKGLDDRHFDARVQAVAEWKALRRRERGV